jgi:hypothetical protein
MIKLRIETQDDNGEWQHIALSRLPPSYFVHFDMVIEEAQYWADRLNKEHRIIDEANALVFTVEPKGKPA